jgi:hypothetical protein
MKGPFGNRAIAILIAQLIALLGSIVVGITAMGLIREMLNEGRSSSIDYGIFLVFAFPTFQWLGRRVYAQLSLVLLSDPTRLTPDEPAILELTAENRCTKVRCPSCGMKQVLPV